MMPPPPPPMPSSNPHGDHVMEANSVDRFAKPVPHSYIVGMNVVNTITQLLLGGVVISAMMMGNIINDSTSSLIDDSYAQHIYLCVTGYMVLMSQAILTFNPHAGWASTLMHPQKRTVHWIMQIVGSVLAIAGSGIKLADRFDNFQSPHGIIGFIAMLLTSLSLIAGVINLIFPTRTNTKLFSTCHGCLGSFTITMAFITLCLAFNTYFRNTMGDRNANLSIILAVGALVGLLIASLTRIVKKWLE